MANASNATPAVIAACIVDAVGGSANITNLTHCATRLHFELDDAGQVSQHGTVDRGACLEAGSRGNDRTAGTEGGMGDGGQVGRHGGSLPCRCQAGRSDDGDRDPASPR